MRKGTTQDLVSYLPVGLALLLRGAFFLIRIGKQYHKHEYMTTCRTQADELKSTMQAKYMPVDVGLEKPRVYLHPYQHSARVFIRFVYSRWRDYDPCHKYLPCSIP